LTTLNNLSFESNFTVFEAELKDLVHICEQNVKDYVLHLGFANFEEFGILNHHRIPFVLKIEEFSYSICDI